jgi:hypothetical protein
MLRIRLSRNIVDCSQSNNGIKINIRISNSPDMPKRESSNKVHLINTPDMIGFLPNIGRSNIYEHQNDYGDQVVAFLIL